MNDPRDFIAHEAALLDARRFDDWLALFSDDGHYWVPLLGAAQADPFSHNSLAYEDRLLLQLRVERLKNPRAHSQHPASHSQHVLQPSRIEEEGADDVRLRTPFLYIEARGDVTRDVTGTNELLMRNQFRAWVKFMTEAFSTL